MGYSPEGLKESDTTEQLTFSLSSLLRISLLEPDLHDDTVRQGLLTSF